MDHPIDVLLYLDDEQVTRLCRAVDPLEVVTQAFLATRDGAAGVTAEAALRWTSPDGTAARSLILPAWYGDTYGCKIINACIGNVARGLARAHGLMILYDPLIASPRCIMAAAGVSALRTAAVSVVGLRSVRDLSTLRRIALLGCGRQAHAHLELLAAHCPQLEHVAVHDVAESRARRFAEHHRAGQALYALRVVPDAETAVRSAEVTIAVTTTTVPYVAEHWLPAGAVFLNVSLDDATADLLLGCDHLFVDDWALIVADPHRLLGRLAQAGLVVGPQQEPTGDVRRVDGELATLIAGRYVRPIGASDRIVINPFGMGVHDVALASRVLADAYRTGEGVWLPR